MVSINEYHNFLSKGNKYKAIKTMYNGVMYDSKKEANRACELDLLVKAGKITNLERQKKFDVLINGKKIFTYVSDFTYLENGLPVIEDVKGMRTPLFNLKKKAVEAYYGVEIKIV